MNNLIMNHDRLQMMHYQLQLATFSVGFFFVVIVVPDTRSRDRSDMMLRVLCLVTPVRITSMARPGGNGIYRDTTVDNLGNNGLLLSNTGVVPLGN